MGFKVISVGGRRVRPLLKSFRIITSKGGGRVVEGRKETGKVENRILFVRALPLGLF